jgi:flagellar basal body rod protein FlgF
MKAKEDEIVDHINNDKYDNRRCSLRIASAALNNHNRTKSKKASSKYFGVSIKGNKWASVITCNGEKYYLGIFENQIDAAKAYNEKATELYGENANLNIFDDQNIQEDSNVSSNV